MPKKELKDNEHFITVDGKRVKSLGELTEVLESMDDAHFKHHVNKDKNNFSN